MDKEKLLKLVLAKLEEDFTAALDAVKNTVEAATHEESKPENEYDTRGLEASYLAGAQSKRVAEIEEVISIYKNLPLKKFSSNDPIGATALIEIEINSKKQWVFLMPKGGGLFVNFEGKQIQLIAPTTPLGEALIGLKEGDDAIVETGNVTKEYSIITVK